MSKRVPKTAGVRKGAVGTAQHDALTVEAVESYLREILTKRPKHEPNKQCRTFNVRVTLGLGESQKLAYYCRRANMTPGQWLAMQAKCACYHLKETEDNYKEIHAMVMEVIERTEPDRVVCITPKNAALLRNMAGVYGETPDNIVNELCVQLAKGKAS